MKTNVVSIDMGSVNTGIYQLGYGVVLFEPTVSSTTTVSLSQHSAFSVF